MAFRFFVFLVTLAKVSGTEMPYRSDEWCAAHYLGDHPSQCMQNKGCWYDASITKTCHSSLAHSHEWCWTHAKSLQECLRLPGCIFDQGLGLCKSINPQKIMDEPSCAEVLNFNPQSEAVCDAHGNYAPEQRNADHQWCTDKTGIEIPDTRMTIAAFRTNQIDCVKMSLQFDGYQCPNSVTLKLGGGMIALSSHNNVGECVLKCQDDQGCEADLEWCCFNGCGQSCQKPISLEEAKNADGVHPDTLVQNPDEDTKCHTLCRQVLCTKEEHKGVDGSCLKKGYTDCIKCCDSNGGFVGGCLRRRRRLQESSKSA